jgi:hypothetical protein
LSTTPFDSIFARRSRQVCRQNHLVDGRLDLVDQQSPLTNWAACGRCLRADISAKLVERRAAAYSFTYNVRLGKKCWR